MGGVTPYYVDNSVTVYQGDARAILRELPEQSVQCCVTSPPYWGLRDYGTATWEGGEEGCDHFKLAGGTGAQNLGKSAEASAANVERSSVAYRDVCGKCGARRIDAQLGLEKTPEEYVARMVEVFREVRRCLRPDGVAFVNMGDGFQDKQLVGIPWRLAFALQADGWYLRSDIIWSKPNSMPESVTDRPTKAHEYLFLLTKSARYFYDAEAVKEPSSGQGGAAANFARTTKEHVIPNQAVAQHRLERAATSDNGTRNLRTVWTIATQPYKGAHFATFPRALVVPCIKAGTSEKGACPVCGAPWVRVVESESPPREVFTQSRVKDDPEDRIYTPRKDGEKVGAGQKYQNWRNEHPPVTTGWRPSCACGRPDLVPCTVLDPFAGSGTALYVAKELGRRAVGIELRPEYIDMAALRLPQEVLPL